MDILLSKYGLIFTEFESIDLGPASVNTVKFSKNIRPYLLSKKSIIVFMQARRKSKVIDRSEQKQSLLLLVLRNVTCW